MHLPEKRQLSSQHSKQEKWMSSWTTFRYLPRLAGELPQPNREAVETNGREHCVRSLRLLWAKVFRKILQPSPLHVAASAQLLPVNHSFFKAFVSADSLASKRHRAITLRNCCKRRIPKQAWLLKRLMILHQPLWQIWLSWLGFFFAMRLCKNTTTSQPG